MKRFLLPLITLTFAMSSFAAPLTAQQALERATNVMPGQLRLKSNTQPQLIYTKNVNSLPTSYVFSNGENGFLVLSADDIAPAILGYSYDSCFDPDNIPSGLTYMLQTYADEIEWAKENEIDNTSIARASLEAISPMVSTKWNQNAPYNDMCPLSGDQRCVTGCVATAMAQVVNYYKYPITGIGEYSYQCSTLGNQLLSFDYANTTFDWDNMLDTYTSGATEEQKEAVATLMYACGVSINMAYNKGESGSTSSSCVLALIENFGFANSATILQRQCYTQSEWEEEVYNQLANYGPVIYSGQSNEGGHCFVCDGYSSRGYFHINWGWGGLSDGYFLLSALNPYSQGIGGTMSGYNNGQNIVANLVAQPGGDYTDNAVMQNSFELSCNSSTITEKTTISTSSKLGWPNSALFYMPCKVIAMSGIKFTPENGNDPVYACDKSYYQMPAMLRNGSIYLLPAKEITLPKLASGTYTVTPAWCDEKDQWHDIQVPINGVQSYTAEVSGNQITLTPASAPTLRFGDISCTAIYYNSCYCVKAHITNDSKEEYYGPVRIDIYQDGTLVAKGSDYMINLLPGEEVDMEYIDTYKGSAIGDAKIYIVNSNTNTKLSEGIDVVLNAATTLSLSFGPITAGDGYTSSQSCDDLCFKMLVTCKEGYFGGTLMMYLFPLQGGSSLTSIESDPIFISAGETAYAVFKGRFDAGVSGTSYFVSVLYNNNWVGGTYRFKLLSANAIDDAIVAPSAIRLYNLQGEEVNPNNVSSGIYIQRTYKADGSIENKKIAIKR